MALGQHELSLLSLLATPGVGNVRASKILAWCSSKGKDVADFVADPVPVKGVLSEDMATWLRSNKPAIHKTAQELSDAKITLVTKGSENYPARLMSLLGDKAPLILFAKGKLANLDSIGVGFCGSRKASDKGLATAADCADQLAQSGIDVVSGFAAGVDFQAHYASLKAGGTTTVVLAEGILNFKIRRALEPVWDWKNALVLSEFHPNAGWSIGNAMQRNWSICALSRVMILIEAQSKGGSAEAGKACMKLGLPLFASEYEGAPNSASGNRDLLNLGAERLLKSKTTGRANLNRVLHFARHSAGQTVAIAAQAYKSC